MNRIFLVFLIFASTQVFTQHQENVDFLKGDVLIVPDLNIKQVKGHVDYSIKVIDKVDSLFVDAHNMEINSVLLNHRKVNFSYDNKKITVLKKLKKDKDYTLTIEYNVKPKQAVYFIGVDMPDSLKIEDFGFSNNQKTYNILKQSINSKFFEIINSPLPQVWTQGQGKYTSHWLPSFDDMEEKVEFDLSIIAPNNLQVIANGKLTDKQTNKSTSTWHFDMQKPMSSYLLAFAIGKYEQQELISKSGIPIINYFYPQDSLRVEPTYRYTKQVFDFLEEEIGVQYPWQDYKQIPVRDFLYAGMENTTATIFSDGYVIDSTAFIDKNYVNVNAHELAHQWFGDLVTEKDGNHHWLHEGFATYYAYLAERELFGDSYYYWKLYDTAKQLKQMSDEGKGEALTNPKASSTTFYEKGAWALIMLREQIGDANFKKGIQSYLNNNAFQNVTIQDFLSEMEQSATTDLSEFKKIWLEGTEFSTSEVIDYLRSQSKEIQYFIEFKEVLKNNIAKKDSLLNEYYQKGNSSEYKKHFISSHFSKFGQEFIGRLLNDPSILARQAVVESIKKIPQEFQLEFEQLLNDKSYVTIEHALMKLWVQFPQKRAQYLEMTKDVVGLPNKNVRMLWLTLAVLTTEYEANNTRIHLNELTGYTAPYHSWEIRMAAFQYLFEALVVNNDGIVNLLEATTHHSWQFKKYARNLVDKLVKDSDYLIRIMGLAKELNENGKNEDELKYLKSKLNLE